MPLATFPKCFLGPLCSGEMPLDEWIDMSESLDVDGLEFYMGFIPAGRPDELERLRRKVESQGRSIPMMCYSPDFTKPDADDRKDEVRRQNEAIQAASHLGSRYCRVLSGQKRPHVSRSQGLQWVAQCIHEVLPYAENRGVTLILENHYKDGFWDYPEFAQRMDVFLELVDLIGEHDFFGINYDPSNTVIAGEDPVELLEAVKHRVVTMHASDRYLEGGTLEDLRQMETDPHTGYAEILRHGVIGQGLNDYDRIFSILKEVGFAGWVSIEDGEDPDKGMDEMRESIVFLREKMRRYGLT